MPPKRCSRIAGGFFEHVAPRHRIEELEYLASRPDFWNDPSNAATLLSEHARLTALADRFKVLESEIEDLLVLAADAGLLKDAEHELAQRIAFLSAWCGDARPSDPLDSYPCFLTLTAGQGGREAQDWTQMLERMYLRWAGLSGCKAESIHREATDSGLRTATWHIRGGSGGPYGRLKRETGVHRLVRLSPFGAGGRQTSFAAIDVTPDFPRQPETDILDKDLNISTFRSSGAGGQNVQKVESAVRIRHIPTGIVVACQRERSQHANRKIAMAMLQGKLMDLKAREAAAAQSEREAAKDNASFGRQLRSYVLHPYTLIKDHRSLHQSADAAGILDGAIDGFLDAV